MAEVFGLDFGTTNSLASYIANDRVRDFTDSKDRPHPSVVLYHGDDVIVGRAARDQLERTDSGVIGDAVRSPKRYLDKGGSINVGGSSRTPREVSYEVIRHLLEEARAKAPELKFEEAIMTIPVRLGGRGRRELRQAAEDADLRVRQFVHEPLAALYAWFRTQDEAMISRYEGKLLLVFDWGGGTLDLTLCRLTGGTLVQIQNRGDTDVGGDVFDERLRRLVQRLHIEAHDSEAALLPPVPGAEAKLLTRCEDAKIDLSRRDDALIFVPGYLDSAGPESDIEVTITRAQLERLNDDVLARAMESIDLTLERGNTTDADIELVLSLGGMSDMPAVRNRLIRRFGPERVPKVVNGDRLIAQGAAWIANDEKSLRLAKPLEILLADDSPAALIDSSQVLPVRSEQQVYEFGFHCVDPRDGYARFQLMRPITADPPQPTDPRLPYASLLLHVDAEAQPLVERLRLELVVDENLILHANLMSEQTGEKESVAIHDLEFGLGVKDS